MSISIADRINHTRERGVAVVEFALVLVVFLFLLLGIVELGRMLYVWESAQEVTRRAARMAVVKWVDQGDDIKKAAVFHPNSGGALDEVVLPGSVQDELTAASVSITYYNTYEDAVEGENAISPGSSEGPQDNVGYCKDVIPNPNCIRYVRASISGAEYQPLISLFVGTVLPPFNVDLRISLPDSTVIMPAEALGLL